MKIEKYLVLNRYLLSLFGVDEFKTQNALAERRVGHDAEGRSYFLNVLLSLAGRDENRLAEVRLIAYDESILTDVRKINHRREPKIVLKYSISHSFLRRSSSMR